MAIQFDLLKPYLIQFVKKYPPKNFKGVNRDFTCVNPAHKDRDPSMSIDKAHNQLHCFACGAKYDICDYAGILFNTSDRAEQARIVVRELGLNEDMIFPKGDTRARREEQEGVRAVEQTTTYANNTASNTAPVDDNTQTNEQNKQFIEQAKKNISKTDYFTNRGLSENIVYKFNLGYFPNYSNYLFGNEPCPVVVIPNIRKEGDKTIYSYTLRNLQPVDKKHRYIVSKNSKRLWNYETIYENDSRPVFITEGEIDALSIIDLGGRALSIGGSSYADLLEKLESCPAIRLICATDNDSAGKKKNEQLRLGIQETNNKRKAKGLEPIEIYPEFDLFEGMQGVKDANDALQRYRADLQKRVTALNISYDNYQRQIQKELYFNALCTANYEEQFYKDIKDSALQKPLSTGFLRLNNCLIGGLVSGLYVISAETSQGKTTYALQIADTLAFNGNDVLFFSLEMSRLEMISKSISRDCYKYIRYCDTCNAEILGNTNPNNEDEYKENMRPYFSVYVNNPVLLDAYQEQAKDNKLNHSKADKQLQYISQIRKMYFSTIGKHMFIHAQGVANIDIETIRETAKRHKELTGNAPVIFVDYLQIMTPSKEDMRLSDYQFLSKCITSLKAISRELNTPVIVVCSQNRESYKGDRKSANMADINGSSKIEYSADFIGMIRFRDNQDGTAKNTDTEKAKNKYCRELELKILKNRRNFAGITIPLRFYPAVNYFEEEEVFKTDAEIEMEFKKQNYGSLTQYH